MATGGAQERLTRRGVPVDPTLRVLAVATLANTMGNGAVMTTAALYFTRVQGLSATQVGVALAVAAAVALVSQVPLGHLGDVRGPRETLVVAATHTVGEMLGSGGQWGVQMGLAPAERHGQYQGLGGTSFSLASILAPPLVAVLCVGWGQPGWLAIGGLVLLAALLNVPASVWALRSRARYGVATHSG